MTKKFDWPWTFFLNLGSPERQCGGRGNLGNDQKNFFFFGRCSPTESHHAFMRMPHYVCFDELIPFQYR